MKKKKGKGEGRGKDEKTWVHRDRVGGKEV